MPSTRRLLVDRGLAAQKGRGQNFLADPNAARAIVRKADLSPESTVLEIGPGLGALTRPLLEDGHRVTAVEIDRGLADFLEEELKPEFPDRLTVIRSDVLKVDLGDIIEGGRAALVGNLPYQISTPLLIKIVDHRELFISCTLTFQRELAHRLAAGPGTREYGRLSVLLSYYGEVRRLMELGPEVFHPKPKVGSTVVGIWFKDRPEPALDSPALFRRVVAAGFSRRRKTIQNAMKSDFSPEEARQALEAAGIDPGRRAETLTVKEFVELANAME